MRGNRLAVAAQALLPRLKVERRSPRVAPSSLLMQRVSVRCDPRIVDLADPDR
jgi:hypothetical protein